jgi:dienelactone hydrolase
VSNLVARRFYRAVDTTVRWRLGSLIAGAGSGQDPGETAGGTLFPPADPAQFWAQSRVHNPARLHRRELPVRGRSMQRIVELVGPSQGPGSHHGSGRLRARVAVHNAGEDAPLVLLLHGYAAPVPYYEDHHMRLLLRRGVSAARLDLPFHMTRRVPGRGAGHGFFSLDPAHSCAVLRQGVEDAAAVIAWARREVTPNVAVLGFSLGGLVGCLCAALLELDALVAVTPPCDLPTIVAEHSSARVRRILSPLWETDRDVARSGLAAAMAPVVPRNLTPVTAPDRITLIAAAEDQIVGRAPVHELAAAWGVECWDYPQGHVTVMSSRGISARIHDQLLRRLSGEAVVPALAG